MKFLVRLVGGGTPQKDNVAYWGGNIPWVSPKDMKSPSISETEDFLTDAGMRASAASLVPEGCVLVVVRSGILQHTLPVAINRLPVTLNQDMKALIPGKDLDARFLRYCLLGGGEALLTNLRKQGATVESVHAEYLANMLIAYPDMFLQLAISGFLDRETAKADVLVAKYERLIELLEEKRVALITQTVTKGLDASVPMKDSGVDWIGEIPAHWPMWRLSRAYRVIGSGTTPPSEDNRWYGSGTPFVTTAELRENVVTETERAVTAEALETFSALKIYPSGAIAIAMYGATIGRTALLGIPATVNQACCVLSGSHVLLNQYLLYWASAKRNDIVALGVGGGQPNISQDIVRALRVPTPPLKEQSQICEYLRNKCGRIDSLISEAKRAVALTREHRSALISAAVTGQIDIRTYKTKDLEEVVA